MRLLRIFSVLAVALLVGVQLVYAQSEQGADSPNQDRSFKLLTEDEDWSFLRDPTLRQDFWDPIKYIRLRKGSDDWYLTIGGEAREAWEQIGNDNWGQQPFMNGYFNERYMVHFDVHYGKHLRTFVELKSGLNSYRIGGPRPIDEKKLDFQAGFLEIGNTWGQNSVAVRAGRLELEYGSERLIDVREGPNVRLSFDGFMIKSKVDTWQIDGFAVRPDRGKLFSSRWFLWILVFMTPSGIIATLAGWYVAETGRQPWVIYGILRTVDAARTTQTGECNAASK